MRIYITYNLRTLNFQSFGFICSAIFLLPVTNLIYENNSLKQKLIYYSMMMMLTFILYCYYIVYFVIRLDLMVVWLPDYDFKVKSLLCTKESQYIIRYALADL